MSGNLDGLFWLLLLLGPLLLLQRSLHREVQAIFLLLTRRTEITLMLFSLLFLPGVILHETSHYVTARLLRVRTGRFSLLPRPLSNGRLQLGFVETAETDWVRDALIGVAPLLAGGTFVAYAGLVRLHLASLGEQLLATGWTGLPDILAALYSQSDFWLWFYLTLAVSSTMLPSSSDRRSWLPLSLAAGGLLLVSLLLGAGPWLLANLAAPFNQAIRVVALIFGISLLAHLVLWPPLLGGRLLLERILGLRVSS